MATNLRSHASPLPSAPAGARSDPAAFSIATGPDQAAWRKGLEISGVLQTTLDAERVVALFASEAGALITHDGLQYRNAQRDLTLDFGTTARHSCTYRLVVGEQNLGELVFMRRRKFSSAETQMMEHLLCSLVYPLRNALLYRDALQSANTDPLTGLNNRAALETALRREIDLAQRHNAPLSLIVADIDHFKTINDTYGHAVGDNALQALAKCAARTTRGSDILFRYGGEEFVVLLSNTGPNGALLLAERLRRAVHEMPLVCGDACFNMSISAGLSTLEPGDGVENLFQRADNGLYLAKQEGRNRVRIAP
ncbi:MAG: GGDEF domain-containing protein [Gammaproteobacteria bacterium]